MDNKDYSEYQMPIINIKLIVLMMVYDNLPSISLDKAICSCNSRI